jgi:hypothetical protein
MQPGAMQAGNPLARNTDLQAPMRAHAAELTDPGLLLPLPSVFVWQCFGFFNEM